MTMLRELQVVGKSLLKSEDFDGSIICTVELVLRLCRLRKLQSKYRKFVVVLTDEFDGSINEDLGGVIIVYHHFDFEKYKALQGSRKSEMLIEAILLECKLHSIFKEVTQSDYDVIMSLCEASGYRNTWYLFKEPMDVKETTMSVMVKFVWSEEKVETIVEIYDNKYLVEVDSWFSINTRVGYIVYSFKPSWLSRYELMLKSDDYGDYIYNVLSKESKLSHHVT